MDDMTDFMPQLFTGLGMMFYASGAREFDIFLFVPGCNDLLIRI